MNSGSGAAGAVAALVGIVGVVVRTIYHVDRAARTRRPAPAPPVRRLVERWHEAPRPLRGPVQWPVPKLEDEPPTMIEVPQRQFVRAARLVVATQYGSASLVQRKLRIGFAQAERLMMAMEGAGIVGPADGAAPRRVLVRLSDLDAVFARFGIVEDALPADAGPR